MKNLILRSIVLIFFTLTLFTNCATRKGYVKTKSGWNKDNGQKYWVKETQKKIKSEEVLIPLKKVKYRSKGFR